MHLSSSFLLPTSYFLLLTSCFLLLTSYFLLPTSYFLLLTSYFLLPTSSFFLPTSYFLLLTSYFLLLTSSFLLLTSYFSLLTSYFLLLTSYFLLHRPCPLTRLPAWAGSRGSCASLVCVQCGHVVAAGARPLATDWPRRRRGKPQPPGAGGTAGRGAWVGAGPAVCACAHGGECSACAHSRAVGADGVLAPIVHCGVLAPTTFGASLPLSGASRPTVCPDPSRCEEASVDASYRLTRREAGRHREIEPLGYGHNRCGRGDTQRKG